MRTPSPPYCRLDLAPPLADQFIVGVAPIDYGPILLLKPFRFHLTMDTLPSGVLLIGGFRSALICFQLSLSCPFRLLHTFHSLRPARHYPRFWIRRSSSERQRDLNPHEQRAAQHTICPLLTSALRSSGLSTTSVAEATQSRSPGVSSAAFRAQSPNLRFAPLMDMDFAVSCPLVRHWRLISGFCSSTRTFVPCFLQTPPRGGSPCIITSPSPPSGWAGDFHPQAAGRAQHTTKPPARRTLRVSVGWAFLRQLT
jgi:hypothetical protein